MYSHKLSKDLRKEGQLQCKKKTLWGKGENAGCQHFLLIPTIVFEAFSFTITQSHDYLEKG